MYLVAVSVGNFFIWRLDLLAGLWLVSLEKFCLVLQGFGRFDILFMVVLGFGGLATQLAAVKAGVSWKLLHKSNPD